MHAAVARAARPDTTRAPAQARASLRRKHLSHVGLDRPKRFDGSASATHAALTLPVSICVLGRSSARPKLQPLSVHTKYTYTLPNPSQDLSVTNTQILREQPEMAARRRPP